MEEKILFLDLDGTLLNDQKEITAGNRRAIEEALERGHRIVVASGRPLKSSLAQARRLGLAGEGCYVIAYNGAVIYDCSAEAPVFRRTLELEDLYRLFDEARRRGCYIQTYDQDEYVVFEEGGNEEYGRRYCELVGMEYRIIRDVRKDVKEAPVKALFVDYQNPEPLAEMARWIRENMAGRVDCFPSSPYLLEVVSVGMNKGAAVAALCGLLDVPAANTVAAGDQANDIAMIRAAGVGAAMVNGTPEVRAAADYVTVRDNNHDGIEEVIRKFLL